MRRVSAPPPASLVWWTDGMAVLPFTEGEVLAWLGRGIARGYVVIAPSAERALALARRLKSRFDGPS